MNTLIISGGSINRDFALSVYRQEKFEKIIGVDKGLEFLYHNEIVPTNIVGDFDSINPEILAYYRKYEKIEIRTFNPVKDATDTQIAIELALEIGSTSITILGGTGTRIDHMIGNVQTLMLALEADVPCIILDEYNRIQLLKSNVTIGKEQQYGKYVSLLPLTSTVSGVNLTGFKYPLQNHTFTSTGSAGFGVSNEIIEKEARIEFQEGIFILIESRD